jgi:hypothetical protein
MTIFLSYNSRDRKIARWLASDFGLRRSPCEWTSENCGSASS